MVIWKTPWFTCLMFFFGPLSLKPGESSGFPTPCRFPGFLWQCVWGDWPPSETMRQIWAYQWDIVRFGEILQSTKQSKVPPAIWSVDLTNPGCSEWVGRRARTSCPGSWRPLRWCYSRCIAIISYMYSEMLMPLAHIQTTCHICTDVPLTYLFNPSYVQNQSELYLMFLFFQEYWPNILTSPPVQHWGKTCWVRVTWDYTCLCGLLVQPYSRLVLDIPRN